MYSTPPMPDHHRGPLLPIRSSKQASIIIAFSVVSRSRITPPVPSLCARLSTAQLSAARAALAGLFLLTTHPLPPGPCLSTDCCAVAACGSHHHPCTCAVVLHLTTCSKHLASLLLLAIFVRQEAFSIPAHRARGPVACPAPSKLGRAKSYTTNGTPRGPPRGGVRWFPQWSAGPVVGWDP